MSELVTLDNGIYSMIIDPNNGARITAFCINGKNCLTTSGPQIGSTFWPSPQHFWDWPPPAVLDSQAYTASPLTDAWVFTSDACPITGLIIAKAIRPCTGGFDVTYKMHNATDAAVQFAHWEITRIDGGLTFYRAAQSPLNNSTLPVVALGNSYWHDYQPAGFDRNLKLFANSSEGWLANACCGLLLKKTFPSVAVEDVAPKEAEVEIYAHGDADNAYIEIEQQGAFVLLAAGESTDWTVRWQLAELPNGVVIEVGSRDLLALAENL
ncbi:MAG: DUF4380 domain-containing protein [Marinagarivorans sp.]|nr:DUF4380 domain-containing protein [Marinagarivorans sp.]